MEVDESNVETSEGESTDSDTKPIDSVEEEEEDVQPKWLYEPHALKIPKSTPNLEFRIFALHRYTIEDIKTKIDKYCNQESMTMRIDEPDYNDIIKVLSDTRVNIFPFFIP